jgi:hypothetical protein
MSRPTKEWLAAQYHSGEFNLPNAHHHILYDREHEALASAFNSLAIQKSDEKRLEKTSLISRIQSQLPTGFPAIFSDHVYRILAYHSTAPFYKAPSTPLPQSLSLLDVQRALVWLLPDRHLQMAEMSNMGRLRMPADSRRLLFQSLATRCVSTTDSPSKEAARRRYAHGNAFDKEHIKKHCGQFSVELDDVETDHASTNRDDDGDEMYHDLLDVLHKNVPENYPYGSSRDKLRPLATELKVDLKFHSLVVPRVELTDLVRALLALQFEPAQSSQSVDLRSLDEVVASVMATFACDDKDVVDAFPTAHDLVAWPAFDQGLRKMAHLFDPVYRVLIDVFLDGKIADIKIGYSYEAPPELQSRQQTANKPLVLSLGWMALTHALIPPLLDWDSLHTVFRWSRSSVGCTASSSRRDAIWAHIRPSAIENDEEPPVSILAFSGHEQSSGERFVGGVLAAADRDEVNENGAPDLVYNLYPFRLAPSVHYAKFLGQEWRGGSGTVLAFDDTKTEYRFSLQVDEMVAEIKMPALDGLRTIEIEELELWKDGE